MIGSRFFIKYLINLQTKSTLITTDSWDFSSNKNALSYNTFSKSVHLGKFLDLHETWYSETLFCLASFTKSIFHLPFLWIFFHSLFLINGLYAINVKPDCCKCISGIVLSNANKRLFTILFIILYLRLNHIPPSDGIFKPSLLNNPLVLVL